MKRSQKPPQKKSPRPTPARGRLLRVLVAMLLLLGGIGLASQQLLPQLGRSQRYQLSPAAIHLSETPAWIRSDIRRDVIESAGIQRRVSILDDELFRRLRDAFQGHPWVKRVVRIEKHYPPRVNIELEFRRPIAAVETQVGGRRVLLPVDADAVRLPAADFTSAERQHLPRILQIEGQPALGQIWNDARVQGAAQLAALLADSWAKMGLVDIVPSRYPEVDQESRYFTFELVTKGGTHIDWGPAPGLGPTEEPSFEQKRAWLVEYVEQAGPLVGISAPARIDLRHQMEVFPRQARTPTSEVK